MPNTQVEIETHERLRAGLLSVPGVRRVFIDGPSRQIYLVCEAGEAPLPTEAAAHAVLAREGAATEFELQVSYLGGPVKERRVKFRSVRLERPHIGMAAARVALEWRGEVFEGEAEGEGGAPGELRACAHAALRSLEAVLDGALHFDLVGIKAIRIFDHDLVAVLLRCPQAPERRLVGVSLVVDDLHRTAVLAVLNATNRLLGNYLSVGD